MEGKSIVEWGKFALATVICLLFIVVPAILLAPLEAGVDQGRQLAELSKWGLAPSSDGSLSTSDSRVRAVYSLQDGSRAVFLNVRFGNVTSDIALRISNGTIVDIDILSGLPPPRTALLSRLAEIILGDSHISSLPDKVQDLDQQSVSGIGGATDEGGIFVSALKAGLASAKKVQQ